MGSERDRGNKEVQAKGVNGQREKGAAFPHNGNVGCEQSPSLRRAAAKQFLDGAVVILAAKLG